MKCADQADWGQDGVQLRDMRTVRALAEAAPAPEAVERLSDRALMAAVENPDHSEAGRAAAAEALRARGLAPSRWRLKVPSFLSARDLDQGDRLFFGSGRAVRGAGAVFCAIALACFAATLFVRLPGFLPLQHVLAPLLLATAAVGGLVWFFAGIFRRSPARIVLLRQNAPRAFAVPLARMIRRELRPYGHIVSCADRDRDADPIANARQYRLLGQRMRDRVGLNLQAALTLRETVAIEPSPAWRELVAQLLIGSGDAIVIDLTQADEEPLPELPLVAAEGAGARTVFVALWGKVEAAQAVLRAAGFAQPCFYYAPDGEMQHRAAFRAALLAAMRATHGVAP